VVEGMKVQWLKYGPDPQDDSGWKILAKSDGVESRGEEEFVKFCGKVPRLAHPTVGERIYFGKKDAQGLWRCCGQYRGKDYFGRQGAWDYYAFLLPTDFVGESVYRLVNQLQKNCDAQIDSGKSVYPAFEVASSDFACKKPLQNPTGKKLLFAIPVGDLAKTGEKVDRLLSDERNKSKEYLFPSENKTADFQIVGMRIDPEAAVDELIPLEVEKKSAWISGLLGVALLVVCSALFILSTEISKLKGKEKEIQNLEESQEAIVGKLQEMSSFPFAEDDKLGDWLDANIGNPTEEVTAIVFVIGGDTKAMLRQKNAREFLKKLHELLEQPQQAKDSN